MVTPGFQVTLFRYLNGEYHILLRIAASCLSVSVEKQLFHFYIFFKQLTLSTKSHREGMSYTSKYTHSEEAEITIIIIIPPLFLFTFPTDVM